MWSRSGCTVVGKHCCGNVQCCIVVPLIVYIDGNCTLHSLIYIVVVMFCNLIIVLGLRLPVYWFPFLVRSCGGNGPRIRRRGACSTRKPPGYPALYIPTAMFSTTLYSERDHTELHLVWYDTLASTKRPYGQASVSSLPPYNECASRARTNPTNQKKRNQVPG